MYGKTAESDAENWSEMAASSKAYACGCEHELQTARVAWTRIRRVVPVVVRFDGVAAHVLDGRGFQVSEISVRVPDP